jgi:hypothetical protein
VIIFTPADSATDARTGRAKTQVSTAFGVIFRPESAGFDPGPVAVHNQSLTWANAGSLVIVV